MATLTLRPNATGTATGTPHTLVGATPNWDCVDESTSDGDVTYWQNLNLLDGFQAKSDLTNLPNSTGQTGIINSVTIHNFARYVVTVLTTPTVATMLRTNSVNYVGSPQTLTVSYVDYTQAYTTNPNTGLAWTWAQIDAMQIGSQTSVEGEVASLAESRVTQVWVVVDHDDQVLPSFVTMTLTALQPSVASDATVSPSFVTMTLTALQPVVAMLDDDAKLFVFDPRGRVPTARSIKG